MTTRKTATKTAAKKKTATKKPDVNPAEGEPEKQVAQAESQNVTESAPETQAETTEEGLEVLEELPAELDNAETGLLDDNDVFDASAPQPIREPEVMHRGELHPALHGELHPDLHNDLHNEDGAGVHEEWPVANWGGGKNIPEIPARAGFRQKWVRRELQGDADGGQMHKALHEGWRPRKAESVPKEHYQPTIAHESGTGVIGVRDLVLMEMPERIAKQREAFYRAKQDRQEAKIDSDLRKGAPGGSGFGTATRNVDENIRTREPQVG